METLNKSQVMKLSIPERIQLVEDIWDTITEAPDEVPLSEQKKAELEKRLEAHQRNPAEAAPAETVLKRIRSRR